MHITYMFSCSKALKIIVLHFIPCIYIGHITTTTATTTTAEKKKKYVKDDDAADDDMHGMIVMQHKRINPFPLFIFLLLFSSNKNMAWLLTKRTLG